MNITFILQPWLVLLSWYPGTKSYLCNSGTPQTKSRFWVSSSSKLCLHDDVIKWKPLPRYWPFVRGIHRSPVNSPHNCLWRGGFDVFFDLRLNKRLSKQWWGWWFETPSRPLLRHCNDLGIYFQERTYECKHISNINSLICVFLIDFKWQWYYMH